MASLEARPCVAQPHVKAWAATAAGGTSAGCELRAALPSPNLYGLHRGAARHSSPSPTALLSVLPGWLG